MRARAITWVFGGGLAHLYALPSQAAERLFAAPDTSGAVSQSNAMSLGQVTLALAVVLALVFAAAWALKQVRRAQGGRNAASIEIVAQVALGAKERAVLLKVKGAQILVGVAPGQVNALHILTNDAGAVGADAVDATPTTSVVDRPTPPSFQAILKRSLGLS